MTTQLPEKEFPTVLQRSAYQKCRDLEYRALDNSNSSLLTTKPPALVAARLLGHLLLLVPNAGGQETLAEEIDNASTNDMLIELAQFYINHFIKTFKRSSGPTPAPSDHPSRPSFEEERDFSVNLNEPPKLDHRTAKLAALKRDGYRCAVTGLCDHQSWHSGLVQPRDDSDETQTHAAHIIPQSTNRNIDSNPSNAHQSGGVWAVLHSFSSIPGDIHDELNGNYINRLENIITLDLALHAAFDDLLIWFKFCPGSTSTYSVHTRTGKYWVLGRRLPTTITFNTSDPQYPPPSRYYLELHALCCEVTMLAGAGEYVDWVQDQFEETRVLARDGSSAQLLSIAMSAISVQ